MTISYHTGARGFPGQELKLPGASGNGSNGTVIPAVVISDAAGNIIAGGGSSATPQYTAPVNAKGQMSGMATYAVVSAGYTAGGGAYLTPTDILTLANPVGSGKVIIVTAAQMQISSTSASTMTLLFVRRSALNTGGTATNPSVASMDSSNAAQVGTVSLYTALPTLNGTAQTLFSVTANTTAAGAGNPFALRTANRQPSFGVVDFAQPITVRPGESFAMNMGGVSFPAGVSASLFLEWEEG